MGGDDSPPSPVLFLPLILSSLSLSDLWPSWTFTLSLLLSMGSCPSTSLKHPFPWPQWYCLSFFFGFVYECRTDFGVGKGTDLCIMSPPSPCSLLYGSRFHMANDWPFPHGPRPFPLSTLTIPDIHLPLSFHPIIISLRSALSSLLFPEQLQLPIKSLEKNGGLGSQSMGNFPYNVHWILTCQFISGNCWLTCSPSSDDFWNDINLYS